jgi:hypothetical protein
METIKTAFGALLLTGLLMGFVILAASTRPGTAQMPSTLPYEKGVLFLQEPLPSNTGPLAIDRIPRAESVSEFEQLVSQQGVTTLIIDEKSMGLLPSDFLRAEMLSGKSIIAIGVPLAELATRTDYLSIATEAARTPDGQVPDNFHPSLDRPVPAGDSYSILYMSPPGSDPFLTGTSQKPFRGGTFEGDLTIHLAGFDKDPRR